MREYYQYLECSEYIIKPLHLSWKRELIYTFVNLAVAKVAHECIHVIHHPSRDNILREAVSTLGDDYQQILMMIILGE